MIYGSVCSGIEAATVAWHPLGWRPAFFSEVASFPRAVLQHHYPSVPLHGDFTTIQAGDYEPVDLLVGGTPCQSFSIAGLRRGFDDDRGNLTLEYCRLADRLRPRWVVWENVPGVLSLDGGRAVGTFLRGLEELGFGWAYRVLDAQYFGVAQRRRRLFVVGYAGDWRPPASVLFEPDCMRGDPPPRRRQETTVAALTATGVGTCGADDNQAQAGHILAFGGGNTTGPLSVAACLTAKGQRLDFEVETLAVHGTQDPDTLHNLAHTLGRNSGQENAVFRAAYPIQEVGARTGSSTADPRAGIGIGESGDPIFTLQASKQHGVCITGQVTHSTGHDASEDVTGPAPPIIAGTICKDTFTGGASGRPEGAAGGHFIASYGSVRRLTPRECERLQGFPEGYTLIPTSKWRSIEGEDEAMYLEGQGAKVRRQNDTWQTNAAADGPRYAAIGNSMAVPVMEWLGRRIEMADKRIQKPEAAE